jgi:potassium uptake TrkH family protein
MTRRRTRGEGKPARPVVVGFAAAVLVGMLLLLLPIASDADTHPSVVQTLFTATSAVTVTGHVVVQSADWSTFGEVVLLVLVQLGGFGIMTVGAVLALVAQRRVGLRQRMLAQAEVGSVPMGELRELVAAIAKFTLAIEGAVAVVLAVRLWATGLEEGLARAAYSGVFHSVTSFNNAGMSLYADNLTRFVADPVVVGVTSVSIIVGGLGFPILIALYRRTPRRRWSLHTRLTLLATGALLVIGPAVVLLFEWTNPHTLGPLDTGGKLLAGWFQGVSPRTAGFNTVDIGAMREPTLLFVTALMFIGAGPASTSGGIKVTTFAMLAAVLWSEVRGRPDANVLGRRLPPAAIRQAIAVVLLSIAAVFAGTIALLLVTDVHLTDALFETTSAFGTVGLSTGITAGLPVVGHLVVILLMFAGRVGPVTLGVALTLRERPPLYRLPEERPIIG